MMDITICPGFHLPDDGGRTAALYRELGATSVQLYIDWKAVELAPGEYDWSPYERDLEMLERAGLKLGPFVICGSWYVTPQFVRDEPGMLMYRCVEHDRDSAIPSLWCRQIRPHIERFLHAVADHFGRRGILGYVILGPTGDYGEALYPVVGNWPGAYHGHPGHWCNDQLAIADLQRWLAQHYNDNLDLLNRSWQTSYRTFDEIAPFTRSNAPSPRAYVEQIRWYREAMTEFSDFWLEAARRAFKDTPIYLCTGGLMLPEHGADFSAQARIAADRGAGIRITNESSDYVLNFMLTRLVDSAARGYGAFVAHEPAAIVTPKGVVGRIFNATSAGCSQFFSYPNAYIEAGEINAGGEVLKKLRTHLKKREPIVPVAVIYPDNERVIHGETSFDAFHMALRDLVDFDLVDENMIHDGFLKRYNYLVVAGIEWLRGRTLEAIDAWVRGGGVLLNVNCLVADLEVTDQPAAMWRTLLGFVPETDQHYAIVEQDILDTKALPHTHSLAPLWATSAYGPLAPECHPLIGIRRGDRTPAAGRAFIAWWRTVEQGATVSYFGNIDPRSGHGGWATSNSAALAFLADIFQGAQVLGLPTLAPTTLRPQQNQVYLTQFADGMLAINFADQLATINADGRTIQVDAAAIEAI
ncbi:MAG: hypothetical protein BWY52_01692 [Chloroflexi bacterium ADurb.Bin325]|nr:MAG: hypothetical protein BWY52_01692 [Chloroflexi bacterium ADurb.Bin325]